MKIYIVRHGQTDWNKDERWQGLRDIPLNTEGILQSQRLSEELRGCHISRIYSSPLSRAAETAKILQNAIQAEIVFSDAMREIDMGEWAGLTHAEMEERFGNLYTEWNTNDTAEVGYGLESFKSLQDRAFRTLNKICGYECGPLLLVAHGTWLRVLICAVLHIPLSARNSFEISNGAISLLSYDKNCGTFKVLMLNALL